MEKTAPELDNSPILEEKPLFSKSVPIQRLVNYNLKAPLYVNVEYYADMVFAEHLDTESWAEGEDDYDAINGLRMEIESLYKHLKRTPDSKLGRNLLSWKRLLTSVVED
jgi:hypothetical protein